MTKGYIIWLFYVFLVVCALVNLFSIRDVLVSYIIYGWALLMIGYHTGRYMANQKLAKIQAEIKECMSKYEPLPKIESEFLDTKNPIYVIGCHDGMDTTLDIIAIEG
jgi:hypothetical protein